MSGRRNGARRRRGRSLQRGDGVGGSRSSLLLLRLLACALVLAGGSVSAHGSAPRRPAGGRRFLFVPSSGGNSPSLDLLGVAAELQERGHEVLVVVSAQGLDFAKRAAARHTTRSTAEALHYLTYDLPGSAELFTPAVEAALGGLASSQRPGFMSNARDMLIRVQEMLAKPCAAIVSDNTTMERLRAFAADAVLGVGVPLPGSDSCACILSHALGMPAIDINGHPLVSAPLSIPQFGSGLLPRDLLSLRGRATNFLHWLLRSILPAVIMDLGPNPWPALRQHLGLPRCSSSCHLSNVLAALSGVRSRRCEPLLEVLLGSWLVEWPRPLAANQVLVGPGTPRPARQIEPADVAAFVDGAEHGLVLVAFGSTVQSKAVLSPTDLEELAAAFTSLAPVRVLWPIKASGLPPGVAMDALRLGPNVKAVHWVDYNDVLGHANTRVLVSHCGMHSVYEAAFHGVPVLATPFNFEQAEHGLRLAARGAGLVSSLAPAHRPTPDTHFVRGHVAELVRELLTNASYTDAARGIDAALQTYSRARHPYERAADEVELAIAAVRLAAAQQQRQQQQQQPHSGPATAGGGAEPGVRPAAGDGAQREEL